MACPSGRHKRRGVSMLDGRIGKGEEAAWNMIQPCTSEGFVKEEP